MPYLPSLHTLDEGMRFFARVIAQTNVVVAVSDGNVVAYCAYRESWLDHLYVHPEHQNEGIGSHLLKMALEDSDELNLWVFQKNTGAIRFYERLGFRLVRATDGADNEEHEPDALYAWVAP